MFTGIVQALGIIIGSTATESGRRLVVSLAELVDAPISIGDSVCVSGVCLTATRVGNGNCTFDVITETLNRSTLGLKKCQDRVNLELSLRPDSFVGGHFVQGHVDGVATIAAVKEDARDWRITFQVPPDLMPYIVPKGSITVDGVSMTIAEVSVHNSTFTLAVIPTTLEKTTLSALRTGDKVNVETDILARTVVHWLTQMNGNKSNKPLLAGAPGGITLAKLQELGMT